MHHHHSNVFAGTLLLACTLISASAWAQEPGKVVGWLSLKGAFPDAPPRQAWAPPKEAGKTLGGTIKALEQVGRQDKYVGVVVHLDFPLLGWTQIDELATAIADVRQQGKKVLVFAESYTMAGYLLACSADAIVLQHKGAVMLRGLAMEEMYLAGLLEKIGVQADLLQIGDFKGARDSLTRTGPSEQWSQTINALLDDYYDQVMGRITAARKLTRPQVEQAFADCWSMTDEQYVQRRVVDHLASRDLVEVSGQYFGNDFTWDKSIGTDKRAAQLDNPFVLFKLLFQRPRRAATRPSIALIRATGPIMSGKSSDRGLFGGETIGSRTLTRALRQVRDDKMVLGAVLRLDSPGGSALASDVIWQAVRDLAQTKPVYVSIGSMAASGGYYIASAGTEIYASPASIVGSIGVIGGKLALGGLYEKIGITVHHRSRGPIAGMFNSADPFTPEQRLVVNAALLRVYDQFVERVQAGRGDRVQDMTTVAEGRIFSGRQGLANGLVDRLGGADRVVSDLVAKLGLPAGMYDIIELPEPESFAEMLEDMFGMAQLDVLSRAEQLLGPRAWPSIRATLTGMMQLRHEPAITLMPAALVIE